LKGLTAEQLGKQRGSSSFAQHSSVSDLLTVRAGRGAAVGVVAKGVDVEATLGVGVIAGDVVGDGGRGTLRVLLEDDGAGDLCVSSEDSNCRWPLADGLYTIRRAAMRSRRGHQGTRLRRPHLPMGTRGRARLSCLSRLRRGPLVQRSRLSR
jgi:hypothetical protein